MRTHDGELRVVVEGPACEFAFRPDLALFLWGAGITREQATAWGHTVRGELAAAPRVASMVWLTGLPQSAPTDAVREVLSRAIAHAPPTFVGLHYFVESEGFGSAIARSVITALNLRARPTLPVKVHSELAPAVAAMATQLHWSAPETQRVMRGLGALRAAWAARGGTSLPTATPPGGPVG